MDGMLSQDEINALLSGVNAGSSDPQPDPQPAATEEILTDIEKDAIGEIANISMGTSATTLYSLVNRKVNITTPTVSIANWKNFIDEQEKPCVFIQIKYTEGLDGANILIMRERDVKVITDLMMGGDGSNIDGELGELHLSAISEAMNQMMGSSATSLSSMLGRMIDISPPEASLVNILENKNGADIAPFLAGDFVKIEFRMQIEDLVDSTIMQLYPIDFAKSLYKILWNSRWERAQLLHSRILRRSHSRFLHRSHSRILHRNRSLMFHRRQKCRRCRRCSRQCHRCSRQIYSLHSSRHSIRRCHSRWQVRKISV